MRPYEEMTDERRCEAGAGLHYKSREWDEIFNTGGWDGAWPEIDRHGKLTGRIVGSEDGFLNVNDEAMISEAEARAGGWDRPDDGYAEPPQAVIVEFAVADETVRDRGGIDEFAGLDHPYMADACAAYRAAAVAALADDPRARRLVADRPHGQRILHSAWAGTYWEYSTGAIGTMGKLTEAEKAAVSAADDAGREAARKVIEEADAVA
jgi:hypothetical protein